MRRTMRTATALLCAFAMLVSTGVLAYGNDTETTVSYEFGSYPQAEIVSQASDSGVYGKAWGTESDYIIDAALYNTLENLPEDQWNDNGDATVDGNKYRRISANDATCNKSGESSYFDWSSTDAYHYFKYEPITWSILEQTDDDVFLLAETVLDGQMYNTNITGSVTWETSTIRSWLNGYDSSENEYGTDYSSSNFIDTAFTPEEQAMIKTTTLENKDNSSSGTEGGNDTCDKVYLLCEDEVYGNNATGYGFASSYAASDTARQAESSTYAKAMGTASNDLGHCFWWLRSPGSHPGLFALVRDSGNVFRGGQHANSKSRGVRPALHISLTTQETIAYTVTFESNGGSAVTPQTVAIGNPAETPADPVRDGFLFTGWYSDEALTLVYDFSEPVTTDLTVYAGWTAEAEDEDEVADEATDDADDAEPTSDSVPAPLSPPSSRPSSRPHSR